MKKHILFSFLLLVFTTACSNVALELNPDNFSILLEEGEDVSVVLAANTLSKDFEKIIGVAPKVTSNPTSKFVVKVVNEETVGEMPLARLEGFESHRVFVDNDTIYLAGKDKRGTIYAIYSFSEKVLGVPPLWYFSSWTPEVKKSVIVPTSLNIYFSSPQVRYRAWFPNDTDLFMPWRKLSEDNNERWLETMLRLKLNTVELEATVTYPDYKLSSEADLLKKYGLVLTSHHHVACNNNLMNWGGYWKEVRNMEPPVLSLKDEKSLIEFWQYSIETVCRSKQENLWQIAFRGIGDQPFWAAFSDAPEDDKERAEVINRMVRIQYDMIKKATGEEHPFIRMTFYDELSDLLAKGYLCPPEDSNILWTFVAARRDHYPYDDIVNFDGSKGVQLGYYMNLQFTSTGAHLATAESPWKMEANYRYVRSKSDLAFSVVNAGNLREFVMELSANARMMWDFSKYDTDAYLKEFCSQYFGEEHAKEVAGLYKDYYNAFWLPKKPDMDGFDRQYIFQDMRYARVFDQIGKRFDHYSDNPLTDIGFERVPGRSFRIQGENQVDTLLSVLPATAERFATVEERCAEIKNQLPENSRQFFHDNLEMMAIYMHNLNNALYDYLYAYKYPAHAQESLIKSKEEFEMAVDALKSTEHDQFSTWYAGERLFGIKNKMDLFNKLIQQ